MTIHKATGAQLIPCVCGCTDLIVWNCAEHSDDNHHLDCIEKIQCSKCDNVVYGFSPEDWNNQRYDQ